MSTVSPALEELLTRVRSAWGVDPAECEPVADGFAWKTGACRLTVRGASLELPEAEGLFLSSVTEIAASVDLAEPARIRAWGQLTAIPSAYAWVFRPRPRQRSDSARRLGSVFLYMGAMVDRSTRAWLPEHFAALALLQPLDAEHFKEPLATSLDIQAIVAGYEGALANRLEVAATRIHVAGLDRSRWRDAPEFVTTAEVQSEDDECFAVASSDGLKIEAVCGADTLVITQSSHSPHPVFGNGLTTKIALPITTRYYETFAICLKLNALASEAPMPTLLAGTWAPAPMVNGSYRPTYTAFVPNSAFSSGVARHHAEAGLYLARWAKRTLWPMLRDRKLADILTDRVSRWHGLD